MRVEKITDDYSVVRREFDAADFVEMLVSRHYRDKKRGHPPKRRKLKTRSRAKEYARRKSIRRAHRRSGECTNCGTNQLAGGYRMCEPCRIRWRVYNARCAARKIFQLTPYSVRIDLD